MSPGHEQYRTFVEDWFKEHGAEPDVAAQLERHKEAALVLWHLDLEPARPVLARCYAENPRGGVPWDPVVKLRSLLAALLVGQPSLNKWPKDLAGSRVLRVLAGIEQDRVRMVEEGCSLEDVPVRPGVGTFYDFLHHLHDGPVRSCCHCGVERPSETERRRSQVARKLRKKLKEQKAAQKCRAGRPRKTDPALSEQQEPAALETVTATLLRELEAARDLPNPNDLLERLAELLLQTAVLESARRGLLGDLQALVVSGDGSSLRTGASPFGRRVCGHTRFDKCECEKVFSDPDAEWGWDPHHRCFFFGHRFYEIATGVAGHDLPLALSLDPGNAHDTGASLRTMERLYKVLRTQGWAIGTYIADSGHDAEGVYRYLLDRQASPVIPLKDAAVARHPSHPDVRLSRRGVPLCKAGVEMAAWGTAGKHRQLFLCPVKAGKQDCCPLAPEGDTAWRCRPELKWGPTVAVNTWDNPRLCPPVARNTHRFEQLYKLRTASERSNSVKKETFGLQTARHRRSSFWLIRLHLIAILQHARAWTAAEDANGLVNHLLGRRRSARLAA